VICRLLTGWIFPSLSCFRNLSHNEIHSSGRAHATSSNGVCASQALLTKTASKSHFLNGTLSTIGSRKMAEKCSTCRLGTGTATGSDPVVLHKVRFLLNDLLTTFQICYVCGMLYEGILLLPNFENVQEIEINKSAGDLSPLQVELRQPGQRVGTSYEFYISSSRSNPDSTFKFMLRRLIFWL